MMTALATFDGPAHATAVRIARSDNGSIGLDLANDDWRTIQIDGRGWRVCSDGGPKFRRSRGMLPLPEPQPGGSIDQLWKFLNVEPSQQQLAKAWLVGTLNPDGP